MLLFSYSLSSFKDAKVERILENIPESYKHLGRISKIDKEAVEVVLESLGGCQSCQVKSACSIHDSGDKKVVVPRSKIQFEKGQRVNVILTKKQEANAVLLAYVYPFFVLMISLFISLIAS